MLGTTPQSTLLVKKADGTSVRMSWDEFKAYKNKINDADNVTQEKSNLPMKEPKGVLPATTAPVKEIFVDEAMASQSQKSVKSDSSQQITDNTSVSRNFSAPALTKPLVKQWTMEDHKSPLEEKVVGARKQEVIRTTLPDNQGDAFDQVIRNLKFPVRDELRPRLKSLIVSRVKDIRSDEQVGEYAMRPVEKGGLGMTEAQVGELLQMIKQANKTPAFAKASDGQASNRIQMTGSRQQITNNTIRTPNPDSLIHSNRLQAGGAKPILHDVVAPTEPVVEKKVGVGPMEEFSTFEIKDFRRLGQPAQASEVLIKKFETMRAETLILYLRAVKAWQQSPLYKQYQQVIVSAINQGKSVKEVVSTAGLKWEEFEAITKVCSN